VSAPGLRIGVVLLVAACEPPPTYDKTALVAHLADDVLAPEAAALGPALVALTSAVEAHCAAPTAGTEDSAKAAWRAARAPWKAIEMAPIGPWEDLRTQPLVDFWPVREVDVTTLLDSADPVDETSLGTRGSTVKGLPVVEFLLWTEPGESARRCDYLVGLSRRAEADGQAFSEAWVSYQPELAAAGAGGERYTTAQLALSELLRSMVDGLVGLKVAKLNKPAGTDGSGIHPDLVESRYSGESLPEIRANLEMVERLWAGEGLRSFVVVQNPDLAPRFDAELAEALAAVEAVEGTLGEALVTDFDGVEEARLAVDQAVRTFALEVVVAFGVTLTFTDNDGD
jgi:predicted lipoprotein